MMNSVEWLAYFRQNKLDRRAIPWHEGVHVRPDLHEPLARSIATFQLGESTEGKRLIARAQQVARCVGDGAYAEAIELFVKEEHEHARLLANILQQMRAPLAERHWAEGLFHWVRNVYGYYFEITVLLMAEIIALQYFHTMRRGAADRVIETVSEQILYDEKFHIRFHCEYLHRVVTAKSPVARASCRWGLAMLYAGASAVVAWDQRKVFRALGSSSATFLRDSWQDFTTARRAIFTGEPFVWSAASGRAESLIAIPITVRVLLRTASAWQHAWLATVSAVCGLKMRLRKPRMSDRDVALPARARGAHRHL